MIKDKNIDIDQDKDRIKVLKELRESISNVDKDIIALLGKRFILSKKIGLFKKENNLKVFDKIQENKIISQYKLEAKNLGINEDFIVKTIKQILKESRRVQN